MEYIKDHLSSASRKRTGRAMTPEWITVHNTGNPTSTAANERAWLTNPSNTSTTGYHIVVDASQAIECIPLGEVAYHAGDGANGPGNSRSIGIEVCESGDYEANEAAAVELIADMLLARGWGVDRVKAHKDWSGKQCPRLILPHWMNFIGRIQARMDQEVEAMDVHKLTVTVKGMDVVVRAVNINGSNFIAMRDVPLLMHPYISRMQFGYNEKAKLPTLE